MITSEFRKNIRKAISLLVNISAPLNNQQIIDLLIEGGIDKNDAVEIFYFLPVAFIRSIIPGANWPDTFIDFYSKDNQVERKYDQSNEFQVVLEEARKYISTCVNTNHFLKIASISAEFNVINPLLLANPTLKPEEILISKNVFIR